MTYNAANQLTEMASAKGSIAYSYSPNGDLSEKVLDGTHKDNYAYDVAGNLTRYTGYDGYTVNYAYSALNMLAEKTATGNPNRSMLEEIVSGEGQLSPKDNSGDTITTKYTYDILQTYYNVLTETTNGETTQYEYGLERIAAYTVTDAESVKTQYVYDVRGSVIQTVSSGVMDHISETTTAPQIQSYAYTPFGEQQGDKVSGYTYNAEYYDSATGMLNLRARQYEPAMMRFAQPDIVRGYAFNAQTLNRYAYCIGDPIGYVDPSGKSWVSTLWNQAKKTSIGRAIDRSIVQPIKKTVGAVVRTVKKAVSAVKAAVKKPSISNKFQAVMSKARQEIEKLKKAGKVSIEQINGVYARACSQFAGTEPPPVPQLPKPSSIIDEESVQKLAGLSALDRDFVFRIMRDFEVASLKKALATLDILKKKNSNINGDDLVRSGLFTKETQYATTKLFGFIPIRENVADNAAGLLGLQYHLLREHTSIFELEMMGISQRNGEARAALGYLGAQASLASVHAYNTASGAIRMDGATVAAPGYESVPSDFKPFNYEGTRYSINISDQNMYLLGVHYNAHGKPEMGYDSKKSYQQGAYSFTLEARASSETKIYTGVWNGRGINSGKQQIIMQYNGKSVIIDLQSGQIVDFYKGTDNRGLVHITPWEGIK